MGNLTKPNHFSYVLWSCLPTCVWKFVVRRKDPEGVLGPPQTGHLARLEFRRRLERDSEAREAFQRQVEEEKERRQTLRQVFLFRLSFFLFSISCIIHFFFHLSVTYSSRYPRRAHWILPWHWSSGDRVWNCKNETAVRTLSLTLCFLLIKLYHFLMTNLYWLCRLDEGFFAQLKFELGQLRFAVNKTEVPFGFLKMFELGKTFSYLLILHRLFCSTWRKDRLN